VDVKYPFADYDLLDFYQRLPAQWRHKSRLYKAMLCRAFPELVKIPCISANTQFVPCRLDREPNQARIRYRKTMGRASYLIGRLTGGRISLPASRSYTHDDHWYRTSPGLRKWTESILLSERAMDRGYFCRSGIKKLLGLEMRTGYLFSFISRLVSFEYWNRFFVDGDRPAIRGLDASTGIGRPLDVPV
jgi:hypothetical protein